MTLVDAFIIGASAEFLIAVGLCCLNRAPKGVVNLPEGARPPGTKVRIAGVTLRNLTPAELRRLGFGVTPQGKAVFLPDYEQQEIRL